MSDDCVFQIVFEVSYFYCELWDFLREILGVWMIAALKDGKGG